MRKTFLLVLLLVAIPVSALAVEAKPWQSWISPLDASEPLVGKIWSAGDGRFVDPSSLAEVLAESRFVLIGETHDNADHHRLQAWLIEEIAKRRKPSVVMEMINQDQSQALGDFLAGSNPDPEGLGAAIDWADRGWPDWAIYRPIADAALAADLPLVAGDPGSAALGAVRDDGLDALEKSERKRLALDGPLPRQLHAALGREIKKAHCDLMPEASLAPMAEIQRYRDAVLADALVKADEGAGAILIAGNGHVRTDRGTPWYLALQVPGEKVTSVMLLEVEEGASAVEDLAITDPDGAPAADYVWITPRAERQDPCEQLRQHLGK